MHLRPLETQATQGWYTTRLMGQQIKPQQKTGNPKILLQAINLHAIPPQLRRKVWRKDNRTRNRSAQFWQFPRNPCNPYTILKSPSNWSTKRPENIEPEERPCQAMAADHSRAVHHAITGSHNKESHKSLTTQGRHTTQSQGQHTCCIPHHPRAVQCTTPRRRAIRNPRSCSNSSAINAPNGGEYRTRRGYLSCSLQTK